MTKDQQTNPEAPMPLPPEITVTIEKVGEDAENGAAYLVKACRANDAEICRNTFHFRDDLLIDIEPQWMLEKAVPRHAGEAVKRGPADAARNPEVVEKLARYGQRLYGFLFGDGERLKTFLEFNDNYRRARLTLALHENAAALWRLPWEYLHDGDAFLALHGRLLLSRTPYGLGQLEPSPAPLPLRLLVIISSPEDVPDLDTEEEIGVIQEALDAAQREGRVEVHYLDDATLPAIGEALRRVNPHVVHYTGHGVYDAEAERSVLALEREDGRARKAGIDELRPLLQDADALRLVVLSGCQTARTSDVDAFRGVATGMLKTGVPSVVAMQFSILDQSGIAFAQALYAALAEGAPPIEALRRTRLALWQFEEGPGYDWGIPALYLRAQGMRLVDTAAPPQPAATHRTLRDVGGLPLPPHFVGRKRELRLLRQALRDRATTAAFVRGIGGMGKSSLAAKLIERPGAELDGVLVLRCNEVAPEDAAAKLANFLAGQGKAGHAEAAQLLLHPQMAPADRARRAAAQVADRRYLLVIDNFESWQEKGEGKGDEGQGNGDALHLLAGFLDARWRSLCLLTGRYRWAALDDAVGRDTALEIHLPALSARQAIMLMDNLSRLRQEPLATKIAVYRKVGGHPKSLELLNGWLKMGRVTDLLDDDALDGLLQTEWEDYFLRALLDRLTPAEREALARLSVFETALDDDALAYAEVDAETVQHWLDLSLVQRQRTDMPAHLPAELQALLDALPAAQRRRMQVQERYPVHPVVREYLLAQQTAADRRELHTWAAAYFGRPFVQAAREYLTQHATRTTEADIETLARGRRGVVGTWVRNTKDMPAARAAMDRALRWHAHLFAAEAYDPADDIVNAVWAVLARWGKRDRAKALLRGSIVTLEGFNKAVAQGNLATLLMQEGHLDEALATYEDVYATFEALEAKPQMAVALGQMGSVYEQMGNIDKAIEMQERSRSIHKERVDEENQAINLHQLSILHRMQGDLETALARSREAETLFRDLGIDAHVAATLHEQGIISVLMARAAEDDAEAARRKTAAERFQEAYEIARDIGDEGAADSLGELGKLLRDAGQYTEAVAAFNEFTETHRRLGDPVKLGIGLELLGTVHEDQGQYIAALEKYRQALGLFKQYASPQQVAIEQQHIARVQAKLKRG
jgi:tetratricopeptide (TPR) repeat protein